MDNNKSIFDHDASYFKLKEHERYIKIARIIVFISVAMVAFSTGLLSLGNGKTASAARIALIVSAVVFSLNIYSYTKPFISLLLLAILFAAGTVIDILVNVVEGTDKPFILMALSLGVKLALSSFMVYAVTRAKEYEQLKEQMRLHR